MRRSRIFVLVLGLVAALVIAPVALAGPDPHGGGGGKGGGSNGGGKPSPTATESPTPTATVEPSPSVEPSPTDPADADDPVEEPSETAAPDTDDLSPGNGQGGGSGIVKLDRKPFDQAPNNEPHVGCTFQLDFYNYPEGVTARYSFSLWHPTGPADLDGGNGHLVLDDDPAGGGQDLDGEATVELGAALNESGVEPHHHNGWHVKLVVRARHTSGPDQKQKVFWVRACKSPAPEPPDTVSPETVTPPSPVAFTGSNAAGLGAAMLLFLTLGTGALWLSARLRREPS